MGKKEEVGRKGREGGEHTVSCDANFTAHSDLSQEFDYKKLEGDTKLG